MTVTMFSPGRIGRLQARNRLVHPPMVRNYADANGCATPRYAAHIARIAAGGVGTIILEASFVLQGGKGFRNQLGIHDDATLPGLRELVHAGRMHGALMGIQLYHGGRQASEKCSGTQPVAPSAIADPVVNELPHELTVAEIQEIVAAFGRAAQRAERAGFDFVEIHGAHGYLIAQFLSPFSNHRDDDYGGTPDKRRRFLKEVYAAVKAAVAPDFPIVVRLSGEETLPGGLTLEETEATARELEAWGAAALHISDGCYATYAQGRMIPPMAMPDGLLLQNAAFIKRAVKIPVIAVGKLRTPQRIQTALATGVCDFAAIGRGLLADPDWPLKVQQERLREIRPCVACNQGCISRLFAQRDVRCTVNPEVGRELEFAKLGGGDGRRLVVIGGGPAGMSAARWGALAGFKVELYDEHHELGGQLPAAAAAPHREDWADLRAHLVDELARLKVPVHLGRRFDPAQANLADAYAVVVATGAMPVQPPTPRHATLRMVTGRELLEGKVAHQGRIVVAGGNCHGAQTAEFLADRGHEVTLIEAGPDLAPDAPLDERALLLQRLAHRGVKLLPETRYAGIRGAQVEAITPGGFIQLPADMLVTCLGARAVHGLVPVLRSLCPRVRVVGDASGPRKITEAIAEGAGAVLSLLAA
jgi:2,4-dienoyl-CoA reductase-like NADH-dependent reductase (Old Yellow Enzyme family)